MRLSALAGPPRARRWPVCLAAAAALAAPAARADQWTLDSSVQAGLELNDNLSLVPAPGGVTRTLSLSNGLSVARNTENSTTKLDANVSALDQSGGGASNRVDGRLGLTHALNLPRGSLSLGASLAQDFNSDVISADISVGRGQRRTLGLSAAASYALSERLSGSLQGSLGRAGYGEAVTQAVDFRNDSLSASVSYLLSEIDSVALQASRTSYRTLSGSTRSNTESLDVQYTRALSERASASLSLGGYREDTARTFFVRFCPLPVSFCSSGLVASQIAPVVVESPRSGVDAGASLSYRLDEASGVSALIGRRKSSAAFNVQFNERNSLAINAARQVGPSGVGSEVRSQSFAISGAFGITPTVNGSVNLARSQASIDDRTSAGATLTRQPVQTSLSATLSKEFSRDASLQIGWRRTLAQGLADGASARANSLNIALRLTWARLDAAR